MKLRIMSDLHLEFYQYKKPRSSKDYNEYLIFGNDFDTQDTENQILILAGDIVTVQTKEHHKAFFDICSKRFKKVLVIAGNHEYYHSDMIEDRRQLLDFYHQWDNIQFLDLLFRQSELIDDVVFCASTLWSNYANRNQTAMFAVDGWPDFRYTKRHGFKVKPEDHIIEFESTMRNFKDLLKVFKDHKKVFITHHAPSHKSCAEIFKGNPANPFFMNDLDLFVESSKASLWIHGHVHNSNDYVIGETRIVSNPFGYHLGAENPQYNPNLVIDI